MDTPKAVTINMVVMCREEDADLVEESLENWYYDYRKPLVSFAVNSTPGGTLSAKSAAYLDGREGN